MTKFSDKTWRIIIMTVAIIFVVFAISSCVYLFISAEEKSKDARTLDAAVVRTTSIAETLKVTNGDLLKTGNRIGDRSTYDVIDGRLFIYFDETMKPVTMGKAVYKATVSATSESHYHVYDVDISTVASPQEPKGESIYKLHFAAIPEGGVK